MLEPKEHNIPWYKKYDLYKAETCRYLKSFGLVSAQPKIESEAVNFFQNSIYRLIFESNLIENAGTRTYGETQRILEKEVFKAVNDNNLISKKIHIENLSKTAFLIKYFELLKNSTEKKEPAVLYEGKSKEEREVLQHWNAITAAFNILFNFDKDISLYNELEKLKIEGYSRQEMLKKYERYIPGYINSLIDDSPKLLTQEKIKELHKYIAEDLLPPDAEVPAGEYRIYNNITVGSAGLVFPSAQLLDDCMEEFCRKSNNVIQDIINKKDINIIYAAAKISYDFVRIHPFRDFNGRLSRILLNMVLWFYEMPFLIALKGNKKERHKYYYSLKRADKDNLIPYSALIAKRISDTFQEFEKNLSLAGLKF